MSALEPMHIKQMVQCATGGWPPYEDIFTESSRQSCYQSSSCWSYKTQKLLSPKGRKSTRMSSLSVCVDC